MNINCHSLPYWWNHVNFEFVWFCPWVCVQPMSIFPKSSKSREIAHAMFTLDLELPLGLGARIWHALVRQPWNSTRLQFLLKVIGYLYMVSWSLPLMISTTSTHDISALTNYYVSRWKFTGKHLGIWNWDLTQWHAGQALRLRGPGQLWGSCRRTAKKTSLALSYFHGQPETHKLWLWF